jgi:CO/xanthine dehydrogenase FAD-binding subunit
MGSYIRPRALDAALRARAAGPCAILAGGTDFYPARVGRTVGEDVLDITALTGLRGVREERAHFRIGALTTWTDLVESPLPAWFDAVKLAAREVGGLQIQNAGTVAGNLCNASPAADGVPPLLALDAEVELQSVRGCGGCRWPSSYSATVAPRAAPTSWSPQCSYRSGAAGGGRRSSSSARADTS